MALQCTFSARDGQTDSRLFRARPPLLFRSNEQGAPEVYWAGADMHPIRHGAVLLTVARLPLRFRPVARGWDAVALLSQLPLDDPCPDTGKPLKPAKGRSGKGASPSSASASGTLEPAAAPLTAVFSFVFRGTSGVDCGNSGAAFSFGFRGSGVFSCRNAGST